MAGLTLEQLQSMGAVPKTTPAIKPVSVPVQGTNVPTTKPSLGGGLTLEQLQKMGAKPKPVQSLRDQRIAAGLPVGAGERAEPTLGGSIVRDIASIPIKTAMSVARPFYDPLGKKGGAVVKSKYFGDLTDYGTQIENKADVLAEKYKKGEISLGRAALGGAGAGAQAALDVAQLLPIDAIGVAGAKTIAGTVPKIAENVIARTAGKTIIPTLKTATKEAVIRGGATAGAYDATAQLASGEKYNPGQTAAAVAMGTAFDVGASKVLPEIFHGVKNTVGRLNPKNAQERLVNKAEQEIFDIQNNYAKTRKKMDYSKDAMVANRRRVAASGVLTDTVDDTGTVRTTQPGGAADKYREMVIDGNESIVRDSLAKEGRSVNPAVLARELKAEVERNGMIKGKAKLQALRDIDAEIAGYARDNAGNIPLTEIHDAKIATTKIIKDFATPAEYKTYQKSLASGLKKTVEKYSSADIQNINKELSKYYEDLSLIESLDGKKVRGGKLGKYFSQIAGNIVGGTLGSVGGPVGSAAGAIAGGEVGSAIRGATMRKTFGKIPLSAPERSAVLEAAKMDLSKPRLELPAPSAVEPKPMGTFTTGQGTIQLPENLAKANAEEMAIRQAQANLPPTGVPPAYSAYPEKYVPEQNLPTIDAGPTPRPLKANLPTVKEPPSVYSPQPDPVKAFVNEPYVAPEKLPTIQMGPKAKAPKANIPTIQMEKAPLPKVAVPEKPKPTLSLKKKTITKPTIEFNPKTGVVTDPKKAIEAAKEFVKKNGAQNGMYAFGGITVDDNGDISYDPKQAAGFMAAGMIGQTKAAQEMFRGFADVSLKTLERMAGRSRVSKQFILDSLKQQDVVKAEKDIMENILKDFGPEVSVKEFANKVKTELLPLNVRKSRELSDRFGSGILAEGDDYVSGEFSAGYQGTSLPKEIRGKIGSYREKIYQSPIKTSAGEKHFGSNKIIGGEDNYFAHTRIEDMADGKTRRVVEIQSDLMQKGNLEKEIIGDTVEINGNTYLVESIEPNNKILVKNPITNKTRVVDKKLVNLYDRGIDKLKPYENDWYKRIIPEEVKAAAQDGKKRVLFPTGETAMKVEGLGSEAKFSHMVNGKPEYVTKNDLKIGKIISDENPGGDYDWVITEVLENGKFKAIQKNHIDDIADDMDIKAEDVISDMINDPELVAEIPSETFDISGKIDTLNPIYRFYDGDVKKYLKRFDAKEIVDENGVSWVEVPITEDMKDMPVGAFGYISPADRPKANIPKATPKTIVPKKTSYTLEKDIKVYRGEGKGIGNSTFVRGKYFADSKKFASTFGNVTEHTIPKGSKVFDFDAIKSDPHQKVIPLNIINDDRKLTTYLVDKGYDVSKNTNSRGVEYVILKEHPQDALVRIAKRFKDKGEFLKYLAGEGYQENKELLSKTQFGDSDYAWRESRGK